MPYLTTTATATRPWSDKFKVSAVGVFSELEKQDYFKTGYFGIDVRRCGIDLQGITGSRETVKSGPESGACHRCIKPPL